MLKKLLNFIIAFLCGSAVNAQSSDKMSILFIGNSYTHMNTMPKIFDKIAKAKGKNLHVEMNTHSGFSFKQHTEREDMYKAINSRKWDYVVLQGYSREFIHPLEYIDTATVPYINKIVDSIKTNNACTNILFYMTWGYKDGYLEEPETDSYIKMAERIENGYRYVSELFNFPIVPVGMVWKNVRNTADNLNLYAPDDAHPNKNGSYLAACTFYTALFKESPKGVYTGTIKSKDASLIQEVAAEYVLNNLDLYKLKTNHFNVSYSRTKDGRYIARMYCNFPSALSVKWYLGDGKTSAKTSFSHEYSKEGMYRVKLVVEDSCGVRNYSEIVSFEAPKKPTKLPATKPVTKQPVTKHI